MLFAALYICASNCKTFSASIVARMLHSKRTLQCFNSLKGHSTRPFSTPISISPELRQALSEKRPIVALESTIITHGLPYPHNIAMASSIEALIRDNGAIPATAAFIDGIPTLGVSSSQLEQLAAANKHNVKISRRDIPDVMARRLTGGTTIAATMILAHQAGIDVFATGGLGGVSRPWTLFDVSADLEELGKTPVAVVCSGPKSILDVQRTMEYLETKGVPVSTYVDEAMKLQLDPVAYAAAERAGGNTLAKFWELQKYNVPGFYVRDSGVRSPFVWESPTVAAKMIYNGKYTMGMENGYVFCAPAPLEVAMDKTFMDKVINGALAKAEENGVGGKELTPFLLQNVYDQTRGKSAEVNVAFVKNNAVLGSKIAKELSAMKGGKSSFQPIVEETPKVLIPLKEDPIHSDTLVIGSVAVDTMCKLRTSKLGDSNPGTIGEGTIGGVGFNVALAATYAKSDPVVLITAINKNDSAGQKILKHMNELKLPTDGLIHLDGVATAQYLSMHDAQGELIVACADMDIAEKLPVEKVLQKIEQLKPKCLLLDTNVSVEVISAVVASASMHEIKVLIEPTSAIKCRKLAQSNLPLFPSTPIQVVTPTVTELAEIYAAFAESGRFEDIDGWFNVLDALGITSQFREKLVHLSRQNKLVARYLQEGVFQQAFQLLPFFPRLVIKDGANGVLVVQIGDVNTVIANAGSTFTLATRDGRHGLCVEVAHYPAVPISSDAVVNVTGAGDTLAGVLLAVSGSVTPSTVAAAQRAAAAAVCSPHAVPQFKLPE
jgi:pseudouridine-5'-phosphate glycosidase/pseudouridine kinase